MADTPSPGTAAPEPPGRLLDLVAMGAVSALFFAAFLALPLVGPLALPFAAAPIVRLAHRSGTAMSLGASAVATLIVLLLGRTAGGFSLGASGALLAGAVTALHAFFSGSVRRGVSASAGYLGLCAAGFALACAFLLARPTETDVAMRGEIDRVFDEWQKRSNEPGRVPTDAETAARLRATLEAGRLFSRRFWVGLIGVCWVIGCAIGYYVGAWAGRPAPSAQAARFEQLRVPASVVVLFVACGVGWALAADPISRIAGNLLWPLTALYFVAGLSIICHFARRWFRARILRVGLYALVIYIPINVGVALLGLFDWYADFRRRGEGAVKES